MSDCILKQKLILLAEDSASGGAVKLRGEIKE